MTNGNSLPTFSSGPLTGGMDLHADMMSWHNGMAPFQMQSLQSMGMNSGMAAPDFPLDPAFYQEPMAFEAFEPMSAGSMNTMDMKTPQHQQRGSMDFDISPNSMSMQLPVALSQPVNATSGEPSLDQQPSSNATIVGLSGESDPYLLSRYRYDQYNEASFQQVRMRKMNDGPVASDDVPAFFTIQHNALASKAQPSEKPEVLDRYRREIDEIINEQVGKRLIRLFFKYVQPYFPVLSREGGSYLRDEDGVRNPSTVPTCVLAAIYGHALPFCAWDEQLCVDVYTPPSPEALFRIAWYSAQAMCHTPSLAVVQAFLLMVQRRPTNKHVSDTPFKGIMWTNAVSIAQSLGLNRDPSDWPLPEWEIRHRRRLAWATYVQDKWLALNAGRSSHIHADDWDVEMLTEDDFAELDKHASGLDTPGSLHRQHFIKLCELSLIVDDILRSMFSLRATKELQNDLDATLETAKPLRMRLSNWYHSLPEGLLSHRSAGSPENGRRRSSPHELDGNGSLHLAYITANIELFRAMLRPQAMDPNEPAVGALRSGAIGVAREVFEFLEGLNARELEAFWASCAYRRLPNLHHHVLTAFQTRAPTSPLPRASSSSSSSPRRTCRTRTSASTSSSPGARCCASSRAAATCSTSPSSASTPSSSRASTS